MPIEVVRRRVKRARELGIDYKTYAGIRAATGRDVIALLFSSNALRLTAASAVERARYGRLQDCRNASLLAFVHPPHSPAIVLNANDLLSAAAPAPGLAQSWVDTREAILSLKRTLPADGVVVVGETALEREWVAAGRLAGWIDGDRYFGGVDT